MSRPAYETDAHRAAEGAFAREIEKVGRVRLDRRSAMNHQDYTVVRGGRVTAVVELKCRSHAFGQFQTLDISVRKVVALHNEARDAGLSGLLFIRWSCGTAGFVTSLEATRCRVKARGGRTTQTRDPWDVEPVYQIPIELFRIFQR